MRLGATMLAALLLVGCRTEPIRDVIDAGLLVQPSSTAEDTFHHRRHVAVVSISHDGRRFSVRFEGSENLLHEGDRIHER